MISPILRMLLIPCADGSGYLGQGDSSDMDLEQILFQNFGFHKVTRRPFLWVMKLVSGSFQRFFCLSISLGQKTKPLLGKQPNSTLAVPTTQPTYSWRSLARLFTSDQLPCFINQFPVIWIAPSVVFDSSLLHATR